MPRKRMAPKTSTPGYLGAPRTGGQPSGTPAGAKPDWKSASQGKGRAVIPRNTPGGAARSNIFLNGGLDG